MPEPLRTAPESFQTSRLLLRKPRPGDAPLIFEAYACDAEVVRYLTFLPHRELQESEEAVQRFIDNWETGKAWHWLMFHRNSGELIGAISARRDQGIVLGYCVARRFWRQGDQVHRRADDCRGRRHLAGPGPAEESGEDLRTRP